MDDSRYVLAMYDVRGKQDYIFRGNKIKEIVGGSLVIRDIFKDYLLTGEKNEGSGIFNYTRDPDHPKSNLIVEAAEDIPEFKWENFLQHMDDGYVGEVIYDGGGNFLVLFKDEETFEKITHDFTLRVLKATASLRVIGTCVPAHPEDFEGDRKALYAKHRITENTVQNVPLYGSLPISLTSPGSSFPIVYRGCDYTPEVIELTAEQLAKYKKYKNCVSEEDVSEDDKEISERILDNIVPEKGVDSHIAVIYIDGNAMGAKVEACTRGCRTYDESIKALREFSWKIQMECIDSKKSVIDRKLKALHGDDEKAPKRRVIIGSGDEINLIVSGQDAYEVAKTYLEALGEDPKYNIKNAIYSSCAGIAVFRSHMPYADAYRIAEECCESGKKKMKELENGKQKFQNTSFLDFHLCQGAIDVSLDQIRQDEETVTSRPWLICDPCGEAADDGGIFKAFTEKNGGESEVEFVISFLQKIGHGNTKGLLTAARDGNAALAMELKRIKAHQEEKKKSSMTEDWGAIEQMDVDRRRKIIYDVVLMYDLWFKKGEAES